jgi:heme oxygenase
MPLMQAGVTLAQYESVLKRLRSVVTGWETWAQANAPQDLAEMVQARRRGALIEQDLRSLGITGAADPVSFVAERIPGLEPKARSFRAAFLGAMYVVEGSTLGGQHIARHLDEALGMNANRGAAYFRGYGERTAEMWRAFQAVLTDVPDAESEQVVAAAKAMFGVFRMAVSGITI